MTISRGEYYEIDQLLTQVEPPVESTRTGFWGRRGFVLFPRISDLKSRFENIKNEALTVQQCRKLTRAQRIYNTDVEHIAKECETPSWFGRLLIRLGIRNENEYKIAGITIREQKLNINWQAAVSQEPKVMVASAGVRGLGREQAAPVPAEEVAASAPAANDEPPPLEPGDSESVHKVEPGPEAGPGPAAGPEPSASAIFSEPEQPSAVQALQLISAFYDDDIPPLKVEGEEIRKNKVFENYDNACQEHRHGNIKALENASMMIVGKNRELKDVFEKRIKAGQSIDVAFGRVKAQHAALWLRALEDCKEEELDLAVNLVRDIFAQDYKDIGIIGVIDSETQKEMLAPKALEKAVARLLHKKP